MVRKSSAIIFIQVLQSFVTPQEINFSLRTYANTIIGYAASVFSSLIGQLDSNSMMSAFLDPTQKFPEERGVHVCRMQMQCDFLDYLEMLLEDSPVCRIPEVMFVKLDKPLVRKHVYDLAQQASENLEAIKKVPYPSRF